MEDKYKVLFVMLLAIALLIIAIFATLHYTEKGYVEFCEERNLSFSRNFGEPICYEINNGKADFTFVRKLNGEVYLR